MLYLAGLFHDIAKGRGGDHSELGAELAAEFCIAHGLSNRDTHIVAWLVRNHLLFSSTAQRKDIYDPIVIEEFARQVGDVEHLNYLYLLTVADIRGTNPELWNSWRASLLTELYRATFRRLRRGRIEQDSHEQIDDCKAAARSLLGSTSLSEEGITIFWNTLTDDYFRRHRPEEVAWHARHILQTDDADLPLVVVKREPIRGATALFIYTRDDDGLFAISTAMLERLRLDIQEARIITSNAGYTLDTYLVTDIDSGEPVLDPHRQQDIRSKLRSALRSGESRYANDDSLVQRRRSSFTVPTRVEFTRDRARACTVLGVTAIDRPGLLSRIGNALQACDLRLRDARIGTFGERAEDFFDSTDRENRLLDDGLEASLEAALIAELDTAG